MRLLIAALILTSCRFTKLPVIVDTQGATGEFVSEQDGCKVYVFNNGEKVTYQSLCLMKENP